MLLCVFWYYETLHAYTHVVLQHDDDDNININDNDIHDNNTL